jgi:DNA-binding response OmpR family regulator
LTRGLLAEKGYGVLEAAGGEDALRVARAHNGPIHLLITDVVMPGLSGRALAEQLAVGRPGLRVLYMSGYTEDAVLKHGVEMTGLTFLPKPFTGPVLLAKVRQVLGNAYPGSPPI